MRPPARPAHGQRSTGRPAPIEEICENAFQAKSFLAAKGSQYSADRQTVRGRFAGMGRLKKSPQSLTGAARGHHNAGAMLIEKLDRGLVVHAPAKVNLFLEVLGKRADGYHEIDSIICPVTLFDELTFQADDSGRIEFSISAGQAHRCRSATDDPADREAEDPAWKIPVDSSNLVVRALTALRSELGMRGGCRVELRKNIPAAAGLGGGSSDAAAAIVAALAQWRRWDRRLAERVGGKLGSDIPLFFGDEENGIGLARATGRGERIEMLSGRPPLCFVISHPPVGSSTAEVYRLWQQGDRPLADGHSPDRQRTDRPQSERQSAGWPMVEACRRAATEKGSEEAARQVEGELFNALEPPASRLNDWIGRQLGGFAQLGKPAAVMTGSGSACFSLVASPEEGRELVDKLIAFGLPRAYAAQAWYAPPIEEQLERMS